MRFWSVVAVTAALLLVCASGEAQIYTCVGEDGSRVFSDQRCGPDAKVVPGIGQKRRSVPPGTGAAKTPRARKSGTELEQLTNLCDAGDMKACTQWTLSGGPDMLREKERKAEQECEGGSLAACEERYCREGIDADCRARVQRTAPLAGDTWYLRNENRDQDGTAKYLIRCIPAGVSVPRDITITCASEAGPNRCYTASPQQGLPRLANAAANYCAVGQARSTEKK